MSTFFQSEISNPLTQGRKEKGEGGIRAVERRGRNGRTVKEEAGYRNGRKRDSSNYATPTPNCLQP
jgi:hypothetical protein